MEAREERRTDAAVGALALWAMRCLLAHRLEDDDVVADGEHARAEEEAQSHHGLDDDGVGEGRALGDVCEGEQRDEGCSARRESVSCEL